MGRLLVLASMAAILFLAYLAYLSEKEWLTFAEAHKCQKVGEISDSYVTGVGVSATGQAVITTGVIPGKTGFSCNNGITYWR
jgi:hypothetical protein